MDRFVTGNLALRKNRADARPSHQAQRVAASLGAFEGLIFVANGMRCPLTALAQKYGDPTGHVGDTIFPKACTGYTFRVFGTLYAIGLLFIGANYLIG